MDREGRLTLAYTPSNEVPKQKLYEKLRSILGQLRMEPDHLFGRFAYMKNDIPEAGRAHQAGTCRFGIDRGDLGAERRPARLPRLPAAAAPARDQACSTAVGHSLRDLLQRQGNTTVHKVSVIGVNWAGTTLTHQRVGRITVGDE